MRTTLALLLAISSCLGSRLYGQSVPPQVFYSDLESGPATGGENGKGVYVTITGHGFGSTRGSSYVTVGSGQATTYPIWTDSKIAFQVGPESTTGNIVVVTSKGASNGVPFTVRSGAIYCVSTSGNNSNPGTFSGGCWSSMLKARDTMAAGDTTYVRNGVAQTADDGNGWRSCMLLRDGGTAGRPKAFVGYPGERATIGNVSSTDYGVRSDSTNWVFANLDLRGRIGGIAASSDFRIVGNNIQCPNGDGADACVAAYYATRVKLFGNEITNAGRSSASKMYHAIYIGTDSNFIELGWNHIYNNQACRAIQFHSSDGINQYSLSVHDNLIHDIRCDGINLATIDPSKGPVQVFNNVIYNAGKGPHPSDGMANYSCIYFKGGANNGAVGSGTIDIYNNSMFNCGASQYGSGGSIVVGGASPNTALRLRNNVFQQDNGLPYIHYWGSGPVNGSNNLYFGRGAGPAATSGNINADPKFINLAGRNFGLQAASPAKDAGVAITGLTRDFAGITRPQGSGTDVGAFEIADGGTAPGPGCDMNGDGAVNSQDVDSIISQALGQTACSGDLNGDGVCNVVDVQRVINRATGSACRVGV